MGYPKVIALVNDLSMDIEGNVGRLTMDVKFALLDPVLIAQLDLVEDFVTVEAVVFGRGDATGSQNLAMAVKQGVYNYLTGTLGVSASKLRAGQDILVPGWGDVQSSPVSSYQARWSNFSPNNFPALNKVRVYQQQTVSLGEPGSQGSLQSASWAGNVQSSATSDLNFAVLAIVDKSQVDQLLTNPIFETNALNWAWTVPSPLTVTFGRDTAQFQSGAASAKITVSGSSGNEQNVDALATDYISCVGRSKVTVTFYAMTSASGLNPRGLVAFYDAYAPQSPADPLSRAASGATTISKLNSWVRISYTADVPANAAYYRVGCRTVVSPGATGPVWVDNFAAQSAEVLDPSQIDNNGDLPNNGNGKSVLLLARIVNSPAVLGDVSGTLSLPESVIGNSSVRLALGLERVAAAPSGGSKSGTLDYFSVTLLP